MVKGAEAGREIHFNLVLHWILDIDGGDVIFVVVSCVMLLSSELEIMDSIQL